MRDRQRLYLDALKANFQENCSFAFIDVRDSKKWVYWLLKRHRLRYFLKIEFVSILKES